MRQPVVYAEGCDVHGNGSARQLLFGALVGGPVTAVEKHMIIGIGCDIVEVDRVARAVARPGFAQRVFTPAERTYCNAANGSAQAQRYAARFAAKEAALKALGTGLREGSLQELEVVHDELGAPHLRVSGRLAELARAKGGTRWLVSLSHVQACAMAQVVLEGDAQVAQ